MKEFAIKENHLFVKTYGKGKRYSGKTVGVYVLKDIKAGRLKKENPQKEYLNRLGFSASPKLGNAVKRNRIRRRLREIYRLNEDRFVRGTELVVVARTRAVGATYYQLENAFISASKRLDILSENAL